jgi:hypothetical protein
MVVISEKEWLQSVAYSALFVINQKKNNVVFDLIHPLE